MNPLFHRDTLPGWAIGLMLVIAALRPKGERVVHLHAPADWLLGFLAVVFLHAVDLLPPVNHGPNIAGNLFAFIWWAVWNILLMGAIAFLAGWTFSRLSRGVAWSVRISLWLAPLLYVGVHYLLHR